MNSDYDGIILGTGHNALILQAYLSRLGLKTLSLDRASTAGGGLSTIENPRLRGFHHNPHSFYHRAITAMPWFRDLDLERHGVTYVEPDLNVAMITSDGRSLEWWTDPEKTADSFAAFSRKDSDALRRWTDEFRPIVEEILIPEAQAPPLPPARRTELLKNSAAGRRLLEVSALSPLEFVTREFENDAVRAGLLFFNGLREVDLRLPGFGHAIPALLASRHKAQMCLGGAASLARGLVADIEEHGGEIRLGVTIDSIRLEKNCATGIALASGETITASGFVASGLNPQQTFLELLPGDALPGDVRARAENFRYNLLAPLFGLHLALTEPPKYAAAEERPELDDAFMTILGLDHFDQFHRIVDAHLAGKIPPTVAWGSTPTRFDPTQAPEDKHTAFLWEKLPYRLDGNPANWQAETPRHAEKLLETWRTYAPNLNDATILDSFALSPADTETTLPNMREGDLLIGSFDHGQVGYDRPFPGAGQYRTPIKNLYLCGGSTHPGGNITGLCGYNAASVIAADSRKTPFWNPPDIEEQLASL